MIDKQRRQMIMPIWKIISMFHSSIANVVAMQVKRLLLVKLVHWISCVTFKTILICLTMYVRWKWANNDANEIRHSSYADEWLEIIDLNELTRFLVFRFGSVRQYTTEWVTNHLSHTVPRRTTRPVALVTGRAVEAVRAVFKTCSILLPLPFDCVFNRSMPVIGRPELLIGLDKKSNVWSRSLSLLIYTRYMRLPTSSLD
jgi:hypothetical protein